MPADLYLFRGLPNGAFAGGEILKGADGSHLNGSGPQDGGPLSDPTSITSIPIFVDHDDDGDLDLLVGNVEGRVILIPNEGTPKKPSFNPALRRFVLAGGKPIQAPDGDSGPFAADWDGDGLIDLLVASADGSVWWHRNTGRKGSPEYAAGVALLPKSRYGLEASVETGAVPEGPGIRTKVCVTDWNGDGRMDLLVGDLWLERSMPPGLTPEEKERLIESRKRRDGLSRDVSELRHKLGQKADQDPKFRELQQALRKAEAELSAVEPLATLHGSVWLFLRQPKPAAK